MPTYIINAMEPKKKILIIGIIYIAIVLTYLLFLDKLLAFDIWLSAAIAAYSTASLDSIFISITFMGSIIFWLLIVLMLWMRKDKKSATILFVALAIGEAVTGIMKFSFMRARPGMGTVGAIGPSFPSGHTTRVSIGALMVKYYRILFIIIAVLVSFSRIYLGVHFFSDILFGVLNSVMIVYCIQLIPEKKMNDILKKIPNMR